MNLKTAGVLVAMLAVGSSCTLHRSMVIGTSAPEVHPADSGASMLRWRLSDVQVAYRRDANGAMPPRRLSEFDGLRGQLRDRLRSTLSGQYALGASDSLAPFSLEVSVEGTERVGFGEQMWLAVTLEAGLAVLGTAVGALIGAATTKPSSSDPVPWVPGYLVGAGAGITAGVAGFTLPKSASTGGTFHCTLVLRRRADRIPVAERSFETNWDLDHNVYDLERKLAEATGEAVVVFEQEMLRSLQSMLTETAGDLELKATP